MTGKLLGREEDSRTVRNWYRNALLFAIEVRYPSVDKVDEVEKSRRAGRVSLPRDWSLILVYTHVRWQQ